MCINKCNGFKILKGGVDGGERTEQEVSAAKADMRRVMKRRRSENENRDVKEVCLVENFRKGVLQTEWGESAENFFVYLSFSSEAPTDKLIETLIAAGKKVYCPRVEGEEMYAVEYGEDFSLSAYGIREPVGEPFLGKIEVCVAPLTAVDGQGNRLGYGKGYYDRFLSKIEAKGAVAVGFCFDFQVTESVPTQPWDKKMAVVVTDKRVIFCGRQEGKR